MSSEDARVAHELHGMINAARKAAGELRCFCFTDDAEYTGLCVKHPILDALELSPDLVQYFGRPIHNWSAA